ncbi:MAG: selenium cofactor biosynthesis protein YqeC [Desulfitobacteriaceae bacterium]|nr:selenium cofactor biosynthesis protein YqeC [Desulfitobacteriaceae bacterium]MDD4752165.1 selenium cofactor biosynthesis protein YqeC [Desulfitobacteriaceae bacterium]
MLIHEALGLSTKEIITFVGAGGKTTTMFCLARELKDAGKKVIITTTTKIYLPKLCQAEKALISSDERDLYLKTKKYSNFFNLLVLGKWVNTQGKLLAVSAEFIEKIRNLKVDYILLEGDGAAGKPLKAPANHEPVIPEVSTMVIPVVGIDALGKPLNDTFIHRSSLVSHLTGLPLGQAVDMNTIAKVFAHTNGYKKCLPANSRWIPLINKVEKGADMVVARSLAEKLLNAGASQVLIGALQSPNKIHEVVRRPKY